MDPDAGYTFTNINLAAFLYFNKVPLTYSPHGTFIIIQAPKTDEVYKLAASFNNNVPVPVIDYISALQIVKQKIYSLRGAR